MGFAQVEKFIDALSEDFDVDHFVAWGLDFEKRAPQTDSLVDLRVGEVS